MRGIGKTGTPWICGMMLLVLGACDSSPTAPKSGHLSLDIQLSSASVAAGEPVTLTFTVLNDGESPVDLVFGDSCMADLSVASGAEVVWHSLAQYLCLTAVMNRTLAPGQSFGFLEVWDQSNNDGVRVSPGRYRVFGTLRAGEQPSSPDVTLTVR